MATNEYLPFAYGGSALVLSPADYSALGARLNGFSAGIADEYQLNTVWRQSSVVAAAISQLIVDTNNVNVPDDGSPSNYEALFAGMLNTLIANAIDASGSFGSGGIYGLTTSNSVSNPTTAITVSVGQCRNSTNTNNMALSAPITKSLTAAWAVGDGNGGRDTGSLANGQTWWVFLILNPTTHVVDALFSQSPTAPTLPSGFTKFRRIGGIVLDAAATTIRLYNQIGDYFEYKARSTDYAAQANASPSTYLRQFSVPVGIVVEAVVYFQSNGTIDSNSYLSGLFDPAFGSVIDLTSAAKWAQVRRLSSTTAVGSVTYAYGTVIVRVNTDANGKIYTASNDTADVIAAGIVGWWDYRGRFYP